MKQILKLKNVSKTLPLNGAKQQILSDISFEVNKGEFIVLMGPSGSGKSTLLGIISTIDQPDSGEIVMLGENLAKMGEGKLSRFRNDNIGIIFQSYQLLNNLNAWENVAAPIYVSSNRKQIKTRALRLLADVGLSDKAKNLPRQLSGGQQQRVAIARSLANDPLLLIADEPTGNLDSKTGKQIIDLFKKLQETLGLTLIIATHDAGIAAIADRVIYLADGYIVSHA